MPWKALEFFPDAAQTSSPCMEAIQVLRKMNTEQHGHKKVMLPDDAPVDFIPKRPVPIVMDGGLPSRPAWECALMLKLQEERVFEKSTSVLKSAEPCHRDREMNARFYDTDLTDAAWACVGPVLPPARPVGRPRTTNLRAVLNAIFYLLRTGCQWRLLPREFPPCGTVYHYFRAWQNSGVWVHLHRVLYEQARRHAGREACPSVVIMDGQSFKTTERGGARGFDTHKRVKGRQRHILVDTLGLLVANRVSNQLTHPIGVQALCCLAD